MAESDAIAAPAAVEEPAVETAEEIPIAQPEAAEPADEAKPPVVVEAVVEASAAPASAVSAVTVVAMPSSGASPSAAAAPAEGGSGSTSKAKMPRPSRQGKVVPRWTTEEEEKLMEYVASVGDPRGKWPDIATKFGNGRSHMAVEQHWYDAPSIPASPRVRAGPCSLSPPHGSESRRLSAEGEADTRGHTQQQAQQAQQAHRRALALALALAATCPRACGWPPLRTALTARPPLSPCFSRAGKSSWASARSTSP